MYSVQQIIKIKELFRNNRKYCIERVVKLANFSSRKTYYSQLYSNNPETIIKLAILSGIEPSVITDELFPCLNYTLSQDDNPRNATILNGIKTKQTLQMINTRLKELGETEF